MTPKNRILKFEVRSEFIRSDRLIIVTVDGEGDQATYTHEGKTYTAAEWETKRKEEGRKDDIILILSYVETP